MSACPICRTPTPDADALARHLRAQADASEGRHVMWLNRRVSLREIPEAEIAAKLRELGLP